MFQTFPRARLRRVFSAIGLTLGLAAGGGAAAAAPPVLDRVPADALLVIASPSIDRLSKSMETLTASVKLPVPVPGLKVLLAQGGLEQGLDTTKSVAAVMLAAPGAPAAKDAGAAEEGDGPRPSMVVLLPTGDYAALLGNFNVKPGAAGAIDAVEITGNPVYIKSVGDGYAAMSDRKEVLESFAGKGGNAAAHRAALGKACGAVADAADLVVIANVAAIKAQPGPSLKDMLRRAVEDSPMAMAGGDLDEQMAQMEAGLDTFMSQARVGVAGLRVDASGIAIDIAAQFAEGTEMAKAYGRAGNAASLIGKLPKQEYLIAFAADLSDPAVRQWAQTGAGPGGKEAGENDALVKAMTGPLEKAQGMAVSLGASPAAMMGGGLFTNTVMYTKTADPAGYVKAMSDALKALNDKSVGGMLFSTTYAAGATKAGNVSVDSWSLRVTPDDDAEPMAAQVLMGLFGAGGGPAGYLAPTDGGVVCTFGKNSLLMGAAVDAASKGTNSMQADALVAQVAEKLPANRSFEGYLGIKAMLDMAKPMLAMMGGGAEEPEFPDVIPPVGLGFGGEEGAFRSTLFVPMPVIKAISTLVESFQEGGMGGGPRPRRQNPDGATGQPRF